MIFQTFNLFDAKTVFNNIAFPLTVARVPKGEVRDKVHHIAELCGLAEKLKAYPSALSGGQKQRVGIARALVNEPKILLSDEATSALDPQTTFSILEFLMKINEELGLTILLITHEMDVIKYACRHTAALEDGIILEKGLTRDVFTHPRSRTGAMFLKVYSEFKEDVFEEEYNI
jgi:D-methionine transport system ATP-binding protein